METKTRALCITLAIILIAGIAGVYVFWIIIQHSIEKVHTVNAAVENQVLHRQENKALKDLLDQIGPDIDSLQSRIVAANDTVPFIDSIETLAKQSGAAVSIDSVGQEPAIEGKDYEYIVMTLSTNGSWDQVHTFISMVESLPYKVTLQSLNLSLALPNQQQTTGSTTRSTRNWKGTASITVLKQK